MPRYRIIITGMAKGQISAPRKKFNSVKAAYLYGIGRYGSSGYNQIHGWRIVPV